MATVQKVHAKTENKRADCGLLAVGSSGPWQVDIDEAISGSERWFVQIQAQQVYLDFEIPSLDIVAKMTQFLTDTGKRAGELLLSETDIAQVILLKDDEFADRFFFLFQTGKQMTVRITVAGADVSALAEALRQVQDDINDNA